MKRDLLKQGVMVAQVRDFFTACDGNSARQLNELLLLYQAFLDADSLEKRSLEWCCFTRLTSN